MSDDAIFPQTEVSKMNDFIRQENARRKQGAVTGHPDPFPENETTRAGLNEEDRLTAAETVEASASARVGGPPSLYSLDLAHGRVYIRGGDSFDLPKPFLEEIIVICLKGYQIATSEKIKAMALHHGLQVKEEPPPPAPESVPSTNSSPDETLRKRGRPRK